MRLPSLLVESAPGRYALLLAAAVAALVAGWLTSRLGPLVPGLLIGLPVAAFFVVLVFLRPRIGFVTYIIYCFLMMALNRHIPGVPFGLGMDGLLLLTLVAVLFHRSEEINWSRTRNDLCRLSLAWFIINILEIGNPAGASVVGWYYEMRGTTLYWVMTVPLCYMVFYRRQDLRLFLIVVISFSVLAALYGIKQKVIGVDAMEQRWLDEGAARTHILFGQLRVFSFYSEAAQFGASQAHVGLVCLVLALGPFAWWLRGLLGVSSLLILNGMLISGTRGALFVLIVGVLVYLLLSKQVKILVLGGAVAFGAFFLLKYTTIGNTNAGIARMRTALDPNDPSLQTRLRNQAILRDYMASRPFGGGVGVIGAWGEKYNPDKFLSTIPPDSYFVKVWAMYGIIGFVIWFGIVLYILGKCAGIVWKVQDPELRQILLALTAGYSGVLLSSFGNEVINQMPSALITYLSWVFIFRGPEFDSTPALPAADA